MVRLTLIWGVLLLAGTSMVEIYATSPSSSTGPTSSNSSQTSPPTSPTTTTHKTSIQTTQTTQTTQAPTNTTTHAPSSSTTQPTTTPVLPTKPSPPTSGDYKVTDRNQTCVIADMGLALELSNSTTLLQASKAKGIWYFNVNPKNTTATGTCGDTNATLHLEFPQGFIHFVFVKDKKIYYIDEVSVNFSWSSAEHWNGIAGKLKLLSTDVGYSVKCKNTPTVKLASNLQLIMADVKLQAFGISNNAFGKETVCSYDRNIIAVAVAVTVLVVIIIGVIIYFICHKRRSSGYQRL